MYFHKIYSKGNGTEVKISVPFLIILQDFHYNITRITTNQNDLKQRSSRCFVCERKRFRIPCTIICPCHNDTRRFARLRKFNFSSVAARKIQIMMSGTDRGPRHILATKAHHFPRKYKPLQPYLHDTNALPPFPLKCF